MAHAPKTRTKSLPAHLTPGNPGNSGGKPGRSGRKSRDFLTRCLQATEDEELWLRAKQKSAFSVLDMSAAYTHGKPVQSTQITGDVTIRVEFDAD